MSSLTCSPFARRTVGTTVPLLSIVREWFSLFSRFVLSYAGCAKRNESSITCNKRPIGRSPIIIDVKKGTNLIRNSSFAGRLTSGVPKKFSIALDTIGCSVPSEIRRLRITMEQWPMLRYFCYKRSFNRVHRRSLYMRENWLRDFAYTLEAKYSYKGRMKVSRSMNNWKNLSALRTYDINFGVKDLQIRECSCSFLMVTKIETR